MKAGFFGRVLRSSGEDSGKDKEEEKAPESGSSFGQSRDGSAARRGAVRRAPVSCRPWSPTRKRKSEQAKRKTL